MRVLVVHNRYSSRVPSGENLAVDDEARWLAETGVDVVRHEVSNDDLVSPTAPGRLVKAADGVWSIAARRRLLQVLHEHRPDIVHVHNLFPALTGSVPSAAARRGIAVVWTVHNRRVRCVGGGNFRGDAPCHSCRPGWRVPGVLHRCYARSAPASALVTASSSLFRTAARRSRLTAVAISESMRDWLIDHGGLEPAQVRVKYNGVADAGTIRPPASAQRDFVFLGRLAGYKGIGLLLDAWRRADVDAGLRIVGDGDLAPTVRAAAASDPRITWLGHVPPDRVGLEIAGSRAVIVPSLWNEPFGRVAAEAFAHARPVITTGRGGLAEIVDDTSGWVTGTSPETMAAAIREAAAGDAAVAARADAARARHAERFSPRATTAELLRIYEQAVARS